MIQNVLTQTNCFKFIDESGSSLSYYNVDITVNEFYDTGILYYDIGYKYRYFPFANKINENEEYKQSIHPFFGSLIEDYMTYEGDTVIKNTLSSSMIDYLLMDYDQLEKVSGSSSAQKYKQSIMISLSYLTD